MKDGCIKNGCITSLMFIVALITTPILFIVYFLVALICSPIWLLSWLSIRISEIFVPRLKIKIKKD